MPEAQEGAAGLGAWEQRLWSGGEAVIAGTDEAGRGPLAGPVVAAAFAVLPAGREDPEVLELLAAVADSKQMTAAQREEAFARLTDSRFKGRTVWAIAEASVAEIDEENILRAALTSMARSVQGLQARPDCVLVDGCNRPPQLLAPGEQWTRGSRKAAEADVAQAKLSKWFAPKPKPQAEAKAPAPVDDGVWRPKRVEAVIQGDARVPSISAASVLAKVHRDSLMDELHEKYPAYGFSSHKGYGTEAHMEAIRTHGVCPQHRRSFGPIREILGLGEDDAPTRPAGGLAAFFTPTASAEGQEHRGTADATPEKLVHGVAAAAASTSKEGAGVVGAQRPTPAKRPYRKRKQPSHGESCAQAGDDVAAGKRPPDVAAQSGNGRRRVSTKTAETT